MNTVKKIFFDSKSKEEYAGLYIKYLTSVLAKVSKTEISRFIDTIILARTEGSSVYFIGNGGSASTASHFANDISIGTKSIKTPFKAISLCDNQAIITAIANDYGYKYIFSKQLEVMLEKGDIVVAISASGNSQNLIEAVKVAKSMGATTASLTAFDGGKLKRITDITVHIPTKNGEYGPSEDAHIILDHLVSNYLMYFVEEV
jgi:D-sedoheptulose 7-phosphate isomerase